MRIPLLFPLALLAAVTPGPGCTDAGLEPGRGKGNQIFDNQLRVTADLCLTPAADAQFPVKILFVVDTSDSMSVTDRQAMRVQAVSKVLARYQAHPAARFGIIAFDSRIDRLTNGFTSAPDVAAIETRLSSADRLTDYQGALGAAYQMITEDILKSSPAERSRSKYVVVFFSDGAPDPQCSSRETVCGAGTCPAHQHCRAGVCKADYLICSVPRREWDTAFSPPLPADLYPELDQGADYNQQSQILRAVDDLIGLQDFYRVGEIRLHTGFLYDPAAASDPLAIPFGLDREGGVELMTAMAEHGFGTFTEFDSAAKIDFLSINYTSFKEENGLATFLATNQSVLDSGKAPVADTDRDGISDTDELGLTCVESGPGCADPADSDGDGYTDLFETKARASGFDPKDPKKPLLPCASKSDLDGDLLRDCEEEFLKTDSRLPDSDGDRLPDGVEFRLGLDPLDRTDVVGDADRDGERNGDEIRAHTNPMLVASGAAPIRYLYDVVPFTKPTGEECHHLTVSHISLLTTKGGAEARVGINRVYLYYDEAPLGRALDYGKIRVACLDARFVDGIIKSPVGGQAVGMELPPGVTGQPLEDLVAANKRKWAYFIPAEIFDPARHCADLTWDTMVPVDAGVDGGH